jgi:hypothetical protein
MAELSLTYYVSICKGNARLLKEFKTLLLDDFKSMDLKFFAAAEESDLPAMRRELHKMYPITSNLTFSHMLDLIEKYLHCDPADFSALHPQMKMCLEKIYELLKSD